MKHPDPDRSLHLGMRPGELDGKPYAAFWQPRMAPLPEHAREALLQGPLADQRLPSLADAPRTLLPDPHAPEDGFGLARDGSVHVAIHTAMPGVSPPMIDWWFAWHGYEPQRYKLWHPQAHVHARWDSPPAVAPGPREGYVGRVSFVDEHVGSSLSHVAIRFVRPAELGFDEAALPPDEVALVCARIHLADAPIDAGYLLHHVRRVPGGSEMRSRFWLGGPYAGVRAGGVVGSLASRLARRVRGPGLDLARDLLVHCSQEMNHLASFLPALHAALGPG